MVERNDHYAFGHQREVDGDPVDGICGDEATAFAGLDSCAAQPMAASFDQTQKFRARFRDELVAVHFAENNTIFRTL